MMRNGDATSPSQTPTLYIYIDSSTYQFKNGHYQIILRINHSNYILFNFYIIDLI